MQLGPHSSDRLGNIDATPLGNEKTAPGKGGARSAEEPLPELDENDVLRAMAAQFQRLRQITLAAEKAVGHAKQQGAAVDTLGPGKGSSAEGEDDEVGEAWDEEGSHGQWYRLGPSELSSDGLALELLDPVTLFPQKTIILPQRPKAAPHLLHANSFPRGLIVRFHAKDQRIEVGAIPVPRRHILMRANLWESELKMRIGCVNLLSSCCRPSSRPIELLRESKDLGKGGFGEGGLDFLLNAAPHFSILFIMIDDCYRLDRFKSKINSRNKSHGTSIRNIVFIYRNSKSERFRWRDQQAEEEFQVLEAANCFRCDQVPLLVSTMPVTGCLSNVSDRKAPSLSTADALECILTQRHLLPAGWLSTKPPPNVDPTDLRKSEVDVDKDVCIIVPCEDDNETAVSGSEGVPAPGGIDTASAPLRTSIAEKMGYTLMQLPPFKEARKAIGYFIFDKHNERKEMRIRCGIEAFD